MASTYFFRAVAPNQPPTVSLAASQLNGLAPVAITLTANPSAPSGTVTGVAFYSTIGGTDTFLGNVATAPYALTYQAPVGTYTWKAIVQDSNSLSATSNVLSASFTQVPTVNISLITQPNARYINVTFGDHFRQMTVGPQQGGADPSFLTPVYTAQGVLRGLVANGNDLTTMLNGFTDSEAIGAYATYRIEPTATGNAQGGLGLSYQEILPGRPGGQGALSVTTGSAFDGTNTSPTQNQPAIGGLSVDATARTATFTLNVDAVAGTYEFTAPGTTGYVSVPSLPFAIGNLGGTLLLRRKATAVNPAGTVVTVTVAASAGGSLQFTPTTGAPGNEVVLSGVAGLTGATAVKLNNISAFSFVVNSDTQITATVPATGITGTWTITKADSTTVTSAASFTFAMPALTATSLAKTASTGKINVVCGITSLTFGAQVAATYPGNSATGGSAYSWPGRLKTRLEAVYGVGNVTVQNRGINGQTLQQAIAARATDVDPFFDATAGTQNWYIGEFLANEIYVGGQNSTAAQGLTFMDTYIDAIRTVGFQVGLCTDTPRQLNQDFQDKLAITNAAIRGTRFAAKRLFVADVGGTQLGDAGGGLTAVNNTRWYNADQVHRTIEGYQLAADEVSTALLPWLNNVVAQAETVYSGPPTTAQVPFTNPALMVVNSATTALIADDANGSRGQATTGTANFANVVRTTGALVFDTAQRTYEIQFVVEDLSDKVLGLAGAGVTTWTDENYGIYFNTAGSGSLKMAGNAATVVANSGSGSVSGLVVGDVLLLRVTAANVVVLRNGVAVGTMARTESTVLYPTSAMTIAQSITAFKIRRFLST